MCRESEDNLSTGPSENQLRREIEKGNERKRETDEQMKQRKKIQKKDSWRYITQGELGV